MEGKLISNLNDALDNQEAYLGNPVAFTEKDLITFAEAADLARDRRICLFKRILGQYKIAGWDIDQNQDNYIFTFNYKKED